MKKLVSILLAIVMLTTLTGNVAFAKTPPSEDKDTILQEHREAINELIFNNNDGMTARSNNKAAISDVQANTVSRLNAAGYEAYDVNPQTFSSVETALNTNLEDAGINPQYSYIILIEGEENNSGISPRQAVSSSFKYTYGGAEYTLRYMTLVAADDPSLGKSSRVNLLNSASRNLIINCLDTAISTYVSSVSKVLGTISSICGLSISNILPESTATFGFEAGTNWTKRFTQVWSPYDKMWSNGCYVEEASLYSNVTGNYYDAKTNRYVGVPASKKYDTRYSSKFNDFTWRKDNAVMGYLTSTTRTNVTGPAEYRYAGVTKITHRNNV